MSRLITYFLAQDMPSNEKYDIIYCGSSFHYIDDWRSLLIDFDKLDPKIIIISDLPAGNPSFVTAQNYYGSLIPVRFFRLSEMINFFESIGYLLVQQIDNEGKYANHLDIFPPEYRPYSFKDLLFVKLG